MTGIIADSMYDLMTMNELHPRSDVGTVVRG